MKIKLTLSLLILLLIACDKNETADEIIVDEISFTEVDQQVVDGLYDNITENEETFEDDISADLSVFDGVAKAKKDGNRAYDSLTGYWTREFDWNRSATRSTFFDSITRVITLEDIGHVVTDVRFSDTADNSIQYPHLNPPVVTAVHILRDVNREISAEIAFFKGDEELYRYSERHRDAETNSDATLNRLDSISWSVNATADRTVFISITRNDSVFEFDRTMNVSFENVIVRRVNRKHGDAHRRGVRRAIVSGTITHTVNFANGNVLRIETEFFNCFDDVETKRLIRRVYKNDVLFDELIVNCN